MTDAEITLEPEGLEAARDAVRAVMDTEGPAPSPLAIALYAIRAYLSRSTLPREGQGEVKPLPWEVNSGSSWWTGELLFGVYYVIYDEGSGFRTFRQQFLSEAGADEIAYSRSLDDAKAAAQADYERRIRSALAPSSPALRGVVAADQILSRIVHDRDHCDGYGINRRLLEAQAETAEEIVTALRALSTQEQGNG